jgi:eukaryotic-like serine/threonine-protein kinase
MRLFAHHLESKAPPPSWLLDDIHPGLEKLILTAMRKNPNNRYPSMIEVLADLECLISGNSEVCGAPLVDTPDEYNPRSAQGKRAFGILTKLGGSSRPTPVPAPATSSPTQSGVRTSDRVPAGKESVVETSTG